MLSVILRLEEAGFSRDQSQTVTRVLADVLLASTQSELRHSVSRTEHVSELSQVTLGRPLTRAQDHVVTGHTVPAHAVCPVFCNACGRRAWRSSRVSSCAASQAAPAVTSQVQGQLELLRSNLQTNERRWQATVKDEREWRLRDVESVSIDLRQAVDKLEAGMRLATSLERGRVADLLASLEDKRMQELQRFEDRHLADTLRSEKAPSPPPRPRFPRAHRSLSPTPSLHALLLQPSAPLGRPSVPRAYLSPNTSRPRVTSRQAGQGCCQVSQLRCCRRPSPSCTERLRKRASMLSSMFSRCSCPLPL